MTDQKLAPDAQDNEVSAMDRETTPRALLPYEKPKFAKKHVHNVTLLTGGGTANAAGMLVQV